MPLSLFASHQVQGIAGDDDLLIGGDHQHLHLAVGGGDIALLALDAVLFHIDLRAQEFEALHHLFAHLDAVFADTGSEDDHVHAVHGRSVSADVLTDTIDQHIAGDAGVAVALIGGSVDVAHIAGNAAQAQQAALLVEHLQHFVDVFNFGVAIFILGVVHNELQHGGIQAAAAGTHDDALQRGDTHAGVHALAVIHRAHGRTVAQMAGDHFQVGIVQVLGGGHAGVEAALAAARLNKETILFTMHIDMIAAMPCNPSVGGPAKGIVVREIDALGGEMGRAADATALQFKMLNTTKGPGVQCLRVQSDKIAYKKYMQNVVLNTKNLKVREAIVEEVLIQDGKAVGIRLNTGETVLCRALIITSGTFMSSLVMVGHTATPSGPDDEPTTEKLSDSLRMAGLRTFR